MVGFLLDKLARGFHAFAFVDAVPQPVEDECRRIYTRTRSLKSPGRIRGDTGCRRGEGNKNPAREIVPHQRNPCRLGSVQNRLLGFVAANGGICHIHRFNRAVVEDAKKTQGSSTTRRPGRRVGLGLGWFEQIDFPQSAHWATTDLAARGGVGSSAASVFDLGAGASHAAPPYARSQPFQPGFAFREPYEIAEETAPSQLLIEWTPSLHVCLLHVESFPFAARANPDFSEDALSL